MAKKPPPPPLSPQQQALKNLFPDSDIRNAGQGALDWYNLNSTPEFEASQMFNYQLPTAQNDPYLAKLYTDAMRPENERSAEAQSSLKRLEAQAVRGASPELARAYNESRSLAFGGDSTIANAQRDILSRGLNSGLQTALRAGRIGALAGGVRGGGEAAIAQPAINQFGQQYREGMQNIQLGNLDRYYGMAGQIDNSRKVTANAYNQAIGQREQFEASRYADRLGRYNTVNNQNMDRYYQLGGLDRQRKDAYLGGRIQAPFLGGAVGEQRLARKNAAKYANSAIGAVQSYAIPSFGISSGSSGGGSSPETFQAPR